jgi:predicted TIM-barrel fold metal-dependent hydrolase
VAEFCAAAPDRFKGLGMLLHEDVETSVGELERCSHLGLSGVMVPLWTGEDNPYHDEAYFPIWAAAVELGMPVNIHTSTPRDPSKAWSAGREGGWVFKIEHVEHALVDMVLRGLFDRFPDLSVVSAENDAGWAGTVLERTDFWWRRHRKVYAGGEAAVCTRVPSDYFRTNVRMTFMRDRAAVLARRTIGVECLMWGSDFPHHVSTWPRSREVLDDHLAGVPDEEREAIVAGNVRRTYRF